MKRFKSALSVLRGRVAGVKRAVETAMKLTPRRRWSKVASAGPPPWDARNRQIAALIPPGSQVLDLGAGAQTLKTYLPQDCSYQPCDLVQSTPDVMLCDFNAGRYPKVDRRYTHVVCSGVLEYIREAEVFLTKSSSLGDTMILSYNTRIPEVSKFQRMANHWTNHFSQGELEQLLAKCGLVGVCLHRTPGGEVIYRIVAQ